MELEYYAILTEIGTAAIANATVLGQKVALTQFAVGDGGGNYYRPSKEMTALKGEKWRGEINSYEVDSVNADLINVKAVIPALIGGFTIREMGLFDDNNRLIAIANTPDSVKITTDSGAVKEMEIVMELLVSNANIVSIQVNPTVSIATKEDIDKHNQSANAHKKQFNQYLSLTAQMIEKSVVQRDIIIPKTGWTTITEGGAGGGYRLEIAQKDVTEKMIPLVSIFYNDMDTARNCGMSTTVETVNGAVRFFAEQIPDKAINASLTLLKASNSIATDGIAGSSINIEEFYDNYVATSEDIKTVFNEVFQK